MMKYGNVLRATLVVVLVAVTGGSFSADARADVYDQVATIVTRLIEREITTKVIPRAAEKIVGACEYFPGSLRALQQGRFSALPGIAKQEGADAIGDLVRRSIDPAGEKPAPKTSLEASASEESPAAPALLRLNSPANAPPTAPQKKTPAATTTSGAKDEKALIAANAKAEDKATAEAKNNDVDSTQGGQATATVCAEYGESISSTALTECVKIQSTDLAEVACSMGLLARDAIVADRTKVEADAKRLLVSLAIRVLPATNLPTYLALSPDPAAQPAQARAFIIQMANVAKASFARLQANDVDAVVAALSTAFAQVDLPTKPDDVFATLTTVTDQVSDANTKLQGIGADIQRLSATPLTDTQKTTLAQLRADEAALTNTVRALEGKIKTARAAVDQLKTLVTTLRTTLSGKIGASEVVGDLSEALNMITSLCKDAPVSNKVCSGVSALTDFKNANATALVGLVKALVRHDYGLAIGIGIDAALQTTCTWLNPCKDAADRRARLKLAYASKPDEDLDEAYTEELAREFVSRVTVFLVDAQLANQPANSADLVVGLAEELIDSSGKASGIRRNAAGWGMIIPTVALRFGWIPGHYDADGVSAAHSYVTVEELNFHKRFALYENFYWGLHVSFIDLLGPFSEIASRPKSIGGKTGNAAAWALVAPRADLVFGVPSLSNNLVVGVGVGVHFFRAARLDDALGVSSYTYCFLAKADCGDGQNKIWDFAEVSLSAKMVF